MTVKRIMILCVWIAALFCLICGAQAEEITPEALKQAMDENLYINLFDLRSAEEYAAGALPGASSMPLEKLKDEFYGAFGPAKDAVRAYWEFWNRYALDNADMFHEIPKEHNPLRHSIFFGFHYAFYAHMLFPPDVLSRGAALLDRALAAAQKSVP